MQGAVGVQIPVEEAISATQPDYTAVCQAVKSSGAHSLYVIDAAAIASKVANTCLQQGASTKLLEIAGVPTTEFIKSAATKNMFSADLDLPFSVDSTPATKDFHAAIDRYGRQLLNGSVEFGPTAIYSWDAGQLFAAAVKASGASTVTPATVKSGLYKLKGATLGGLTPPLTFSHGKPTISNCYFALNATNGTFTVKGLSPICAPQSLISKGAQPLLSGQ
jgi:branched-chain amino acid transport system substrate-binding protein